MVSIETVSDAVRFIDFVDYFIGIFLGSCGEDRDFIIERKFL